MGGAPLLCLFEKETGYRLNLRSVYMHGVNSVGGPNSSQGIVGQESGLNAIGKSVSRVNVDNILSIFSNQSLPFLSSATPPDS